MSTLENIYIRGFSCDARNCKVEITGQEIESFRGRKIYQTKASALGWSCWSSRSVYHYCPQHGPGKVHQMRRHW